MPAAGYRHCSSGVLSGVGTEGVYWSSSSYAAGNISVGSLGFDSGDVRPLHYSYRAHSLSVRCVQHLQGAVFYLFERKYPDFPMSPARDEFKYKYSDIFSHNRFGPQPPYNKIPATWIGRRY